MQDTLTIKNNCGFPAAAGNEKGMALILVLIMLVLLSILGVTVYTSTLSDLHITSNYRNLDDSFFAADAAMDFAQAYGSIYTSILPATATVWPAAGAGKILNDDGSLSVTANATFPDYNRITVYKNAAKTVRNYAHVKVDYLSTGAVPPGMGTEVDAGLGSGTGFKANFYAVDVIAEGESPKNSHVELESHIVRVVPK